MTCVRRGSRTGGCGQQAGTREWAAHVEAGPHKAAVAHAREEGEKNETGPAWWAEKEKKVNSAEKRKKN